MLSIIIPTFNERDNMPLIIPQLSKILNKEMIPFEILVMDDDSPDRTSEEVDRLSSEYPEARCVVRKVNKGLSPAVMDGYKEAKGEIYLVMDADLSHPVEKVPAMYHAIATEGNEVSIGSRHNKPIITKGFVTITGKDNHKGFRVISEEVLNRDFNWKGK